MRPRVLYVTYDGLLEPLGASQVTPVVDGLARRGFAMAVLSFEKSPDLRNDERREGLRARLERSGVRWISHVYHRRPSLVATAWDVARGRATVRRSLGDSPGPRVIHARSYVPGVMGLAAAGRGRASLLLDMRGFWVDERLESGRWRAANPVTAWARRYERALLDASSHVVHLTEAGRREAHRLGGSDAPASVIPTCVDLTRFPGRAGRDPKGLRERLGVGPAPVLLHVGTLSGWYLGADTFEVARAWVAGTGGSFVVLTREVGLARRLANEVGVAARIESVPHEDVPDWMAAADAGLCLVRPGMSKRASAPTKIGEYLASGLAVLATAGVGDLDRQFDGSAVAFTIPVPIDAEAAVTRLALAAAHPDRNREARSVAGRHYDLEWAIDRYSAIYESMGVRPCG